MLREKKPIDKMEMMHMLGIIYAQTAVGYGKVGLQTLMEKYAKPSVKTKNRIITKAILESGLLFREGYGHTQAYKWNLKEYGPPSLLIAEMLITLAEHIARRDKREWRRKHDNSRVH